MQPTPEQSEVIAHTGGHAIVSAVAGSGKSATLIERICHLLERGVAPDRILVLMFNKGARDDFAARLRARLANAPAPEVFTFHGFGYRLCARMEQFGLLERRPLLTAARDTHPLARQAIQRTNLTLPDESKIDPSPEVVSDFLNTVDVLKGLLHPPDADCAPEKISVTPSFLRAYADLELLRMNRGFRLFGDLIADPVRLALADPSVANFMANRYEHIIVDEFQDINESQMSMVRLLAGSRAKVMVVGDDDQTIYAWRGACPDWMIAGFEKAFTGVTRYSLSRTFRYGHRLSLFANFTIHRNRSRIDKLCVSGTERETDVAIRMHAALAGPATGVVSEIEDWVSKGGQRSDVTILVREYANAAEIELALSQQGIPYRLVGSPSFADRPEIMALRAHMSLATGALDLIDTESVRLGMLEALLHYPTLYLRKEEWNAARHFIGSLHTDIAASLARWLDALAARAGKPYLRERRHDAGALLRWSAGQRSASRADPFLQHIVRKSAMYDTIDKQTSNPLRSGEKVRLVAKLIGLASTHAYSIEEFAHLLNQISARAQEAVEADSVLITSIHRSKGLEWPCVILPDLTEGQFPAEPDEDAIEDERRLFYVAATRAQKQLVVCTPQDAALVQWSQAGKVGHPEVGQARASRFVYEANPHWSSALGDALYRRDTTVTPPPELAPIWNRYWEALHG